MAGEWEARSRPYSTTEQFAGGSVHRLQHQRTKENPTMSTNALLIILIVLVLLGGGGYFWRR
ncbi:MAG: hypothetical protein JWO36_6328 [Myxococcales bacterium]|nr:hypothetical protein [Myxococcales bacterium]